MFAFFRCARAACVVALCRPDARRRRIRLSGSLRPRARESLAPARPCRLRSRRKKPKKTFRPLKSHIAGTKRAELHSIARRTLGT